MTTSRPELALDDRRVARALFTLRESAAYLDVPVSTLHQWARPTGAESLVTILPGAGRAATVPFVGFDGGVRPERAPARRGSNAADTTGGGSPQR